MHAKNALQKIENKYFTTKIILRDIKNEHKFQVKNNRKFTLQ